MTDEAPPTKHLGSHIFNLAVLVIGGAALVWMMHDLGWQRARDVITDLGAWAWLILGLDFLSLALDAAAIHSFMRPEARMVSYWRVLAAQLSGRAINALIPGGAIGEATKVTMLVGHAPRERVVSSIVLLNLASFYLSVATVVIGVPITIALVDLPRELEITVGVAFAVLVPLVLALVWIVHRGALRTVLASAHGLRILSGPRAKKLGDKLLAFDDHLRELHTDRSPGTNAGIAWLCASRLVSWTALAIVLHTLGIAITFTLMVGALSVGVLIGWVSSVVPFGLGVADGGNYLLYDVLGASGAHGVFVTMLGRARAIALAMVGLAVMAAGHAATRMTIARRRKHFDALRAAPRG